MTTTDANPPAIPFIFYTHDFGPHRRLASAELASI